MLLVIVLAMLAQTPVPFPRPGAPKPSAPPATQQPQPRVQPPGQPAPSPTDPPTEASLGVPVYPGAEFLISYDATRGQRYYLFGTNAGFVEIVTLQDPCEQKGELVYESPACSSSNRRFGRRRWLSASVTVRITVGDSAGFLNQARPAPARFKTIIQCTPPIASSAPPYMQLSGSRAGEMSCLTGSRAQELYEGSRPISDS